ncbi:MAG: translation initiation factor 2 [Pseudomonadota bacterium]
MKLKLIALAGVAALSLGGCATVVNGVHQDLSFASDPDGAVVAMSTGQTCTTPCEYSLRRGHDLRVDFTKAGYKPEFVYVQSRLAGSTFGNIILGGGIGAVVDGSNGSSNRLYPNPVSIRLVREGSAEQAVLLDEDGAVISTVAEYNASVEADVLEGMANRGQIESTHGDD